MQSTGWVQFESLGRGFVKSSVSGILLGGVLALAGCTVDRVRPAPASASASIADGAIVGGAILGIDNAVWADQNNDGVVDGFVRNGQYYPGIPPGYDRVLRRVTAHPPTDAPPPGFNSGAVVGRPVAGLPGGIWSDANGDGVVDGYTVNGRYVPGAPQSASGATPANSAAQSPPPPARGERG